MSHVYAYGLQCPKAKGIIHLGATSCYVGDNTDVIIMREALQLVRKKIIGVLANLAEFADEYKAMPCLAYTHLPARPADHRGQARHPVDERAVHGSCKRSTTRSASWRCAASRAPPARRPALWSCSTATPPRSRPWRPTSAAEMGFDKVRAGLRPDLQPQGGLQRAVRPGRHCPERHEDSATDMRLLANFKEMEEPFEKNQIGSSAMPYKRNPMRCERICALARYRDGGRAQPRHDRRHPVVRAHAGRLAPTSASPWPRASWPPTPS